jgi:transposase-like protein
MMAVKKNPEMVGRRYNSIHWQKYAMTDEQRALLIQMYDSKSATITYLAETFNVPRFTIRIWASQLGIANKGRREWSQKDLEYLATHYCTMAVEDIALKLHRSVTAIRRKASDLGINKLSDGYTVQSLREAFGCTTYTIQKWIDLGWLKAKKRKSERKENSDYWFISDDSVRSFIKDHWNEIDQHKVYWPWLRDMVFGGEKGLGSLVEPRGQAS